MLLKALKVTQNKSQSCEWNLEDCTFDKINLIVGENATGKSRIAIFIKALSDLFSEYHELPFSDKVDYHIEFEDDDDKIVYDLSYGNNKVDSEILDINGKSYLERDSSGTGKILAEALPEDKNSTKKGKSTNSKKSREIGFEIDKNKISLYAKRDKVQHPFLELLYNWGNGLRFFSFGTPLGRDRAEPFNIFSPSTELTEKIILKDYNLVLRVFKKGLEDYKNDFVNRIKEDMKRINYKLDDIAINKLTHGFPKGIDILGLVIKESGLKCRVEQTFISQGMFRVLSLIIQLNYLKFASSSKKYSNCILIDDIGEGLDYGRSSSLVNLLIEYAKTTNIQLIMTTNDRFIMNNVPLEYWSVIKRTGNTSKIYNYRNSRDIFDKFEYTGLNNFDFFSSKYYSKKPTKASKGQ